MRKSASRTHAPAGTTTTSPPQDPRDQEIQRLRTLVAELTRRNEVLQEAIRRLQDTGRP